MTEPILVTTGNDGVAEVLLNDPDRLNVLTYGDGGMRQELVAALLSLDTDSDVGAIVLRGAGRSFCAGGDLTSEGRETPEDSYLYMQRAEEFYRTIRSVRKPLIAAVHGYCLGAGLMLVAQCDLRIASESASLGMMEARIGVPGPTYLVEALGLQWALFLMMTGETISARRAKEIGLVLEVFPDDEMHDQARDLAVRIARLPRSAVRLNKRAARAVADAMGAENGRSVGTTHDSLTSSMAKEAEAPDGQRFSELIRSGGFPALKKARESQYSGTWLPY